MRAETNSDKFFTWVEGGVIRALVPGNIVR